MGIRVSYTREKSFSARISRSFPAPAGRVSFRSSASGIHTPLPEGEISFDFPCSRRRSTPVRRMRCVVNACETGPIRPITVGSGQYDDAIRSAAESGVSSAPSGSHGNSVMPAQSPESGLRRRRTLSSSSTIAATAFSVVRFFRATAALFGVRAFARPLQVAATGQISHDGRTGVQTSAPRSMIAWLNDRASPSGMKSARKSDTSRSFRNSRPRIRDATRRAFASTAVAERLNAMLEIAPAV
jgi:hypothetical protein